MFSMPTGNFKSAAPIVNIQRRVEVDENGVEILETEEFWLVDQNGQTLDGGGPFSTAKEASVARNNYLNDLGYES